MTVMNHDPLADLDAMHLVDPQEAAPNPEPAVQTHADTTPEAPSAAAETSDTCKETPIELGEALTIQDVEAAWREWRPHLDQGGVPLPLDPSRLQEIDGAGLQLLCLLSKHRPLHWTAPSRPLQEAARVLGVTTALALTPEDMA